MRCRAGPAPPCGSGVVGPESLSSIGVIAALMEAEPEDYIVLSIALGEIRAHGAVIPRDVVVMGPQDDLRPGGG